MFIECTFLPKQIHCLCKLSWRINPFLILILTRHVLSLSHHFHFLFGFYLVFIRWVPSNLLHHSLLFCIWLNVSCGITWETQTEVRGESPFWQKSIRGSPCLKSCTVTGLQVSPSVCFSLSLWQWLSFSVMHIKLQGVKAKMTSCD